MTKVEINKTALKEPTRRLLVVDRWIIALVVGLVALLLLIDHYKSANSSAVMQVVMFLFFMVIYVWPTAIALRSSSLHGFLKYLFGLTAVPVFVGLFVASVHVLNEVSFFVQGFSEAQRSGHRRNEVGFVMIAIAPAAFIFWLWYKALTIFDRAIFRPTL